MAASYRSLRPKLPSSDESNHESDPSSTNGRPPNTSRACDACRQRKTKCNGRRPACSTCLRTGAVCSYSIRARTLPGSEIDRDAFMFQMLRSLPPRGAAQLLHKLRLNDGTELNPYPAVSERALLKSYLAPTRNSVEFELMARHPISYPPLFQIDTGSILLEPLLRPSRISAIKAETPAQRDRPLVDERLRKLEMSYWTKAPISNDLAAKILSLYIETDYQTLPLFNLDLFIEDLIHNRPYFCSKLLVNALYSWICQTYTPIDPVAQNLSEAFFNEAQSLIVDKPELITLTTVSALQCLCIAAFGYGRDRLGMHFLRKGANIGTTMGLFGFGSEVESAISWLGDEDDWKRSASYTAWGVHNWISLWGLRYHSMEILMPPKIPMPGTLNTGLETQRFDTDTESINVKVFKACCELWVVCNQVRRMHRQIDLGNSTSHRHEVAEQAFRQLLGWANTLPLDLVRSDQSTHAVIMMHIYFHAMVADFFRSFPNISTTPFCMRSFETPQVTPRAVYDASINQLKRLLLMFRTSFQTASLSILSQTVLIYVGHAVIQDAQSSEQLERRLYIRLCLAALEDLYGSYRESWSVTRGLLSMALKRGIIAPEEAGRIRQEMTELGQHHSTPDDVDTRSILDLDLATFNTSAAQVSTVAAQFEDLLLEAKVEK